MRSSAYAASRVDPGTWRRSLLVVLAVALSHGWGAILRAPTQGYSEPASFTFLFGFMGEILLWLGTSASIIAGARVLSRRRVSFGDVARPVALAATPGLGVVLAGALSGDGRFSAVLLVVMGVWRLAASYVAVREGMAAPAGKAVAWLSLGLAGGIGLMGAGTAMLNILSTR